MIMTFNPTRLKSSSNVIINKIHNKISSLCHSVVQGPYRIFEKKFPEFSLRGQPNFPEF